MKKTIENNFVVAIKKSVENLVDGFSFGIPKDFKNNHIFVEVGPMSGNFTKRDYGEVQEFVLHICTNTLSESGEIKEKLINALDDLRVDGFSVIDTSLKFNTTFREVDKTYHAVATLSVTAFNL